MTWQTGRSMRPPTAKELGILKRAADGLQEDIKALAGREISDDVLGTMRVNLLAMLNVLAKLEKVDFDE